MKFFLLLFSVAKCNDLALHLPIYSSYTSSIGLYPIAFIVQLSVMLVFAFLPLKKLRRMQEYSMVGLCYFFLVGQFAYYIGLYVLGILAILASYAGAVVAVLLSVKYEYQDALLSVGAGYISSYFLSILLRIKNIVLYFIMYVLCTVLLYFVSLKMDMLFYCLCRALVYSLALVVGLDVFCPWSCVKAFHGEARVLPRVGFYLGIVEILGFSVVIFLYSLYLEKRDLGVKGEDV